MTSRPWTHKDSLFLTQAHERCGIPWCASQLHRTVEDCVAQLKALGAGQEDEWIDVGSAGRLASCSGSTVRALAVKGIVEGRKTQVGRWEVRRDSVLAYAAEHQRVTEESGLEVAKGYVRPKKPRRKPKTPSERPVEAKEGAGMENLPSETADASEPPSNAQNDEQAKTDENLELAGWVPVEEYAEAAGVSRKEAVRRCWEGKVSCRKQGKSWLVSETEAVIAQPREEPKPKPARSLEAMSKLDILKAIAAGMDLGASGGNA